MVLFAHNLYAGRRGSSSGHLRRPRRLADPRAPRWPLSFRHLPVQRVTPVAPPLAMVWWCVCCCGPCGGIRPGGRPAPSPRLGRVWRGVVLCQPVQCGVRCAACAGRNAWTILKDGDRPRRRCDGRPRPPPGVFVAAIASRVLESRSIVLLDAQRHHHLGRRRPLLFCASASRGPAPAWRASPIEPQAALRDHEGMGITGHLVYLLVPQTGIQLRL